MSPATFEKMLADKKTPDEKKEEIRALMPLVSNGTVVSVYRVGQLSALSVKDT